MRNQTAHRLFMEIPPVTGLYPQSTMLATKLHCHVKIEWKAIVPLSSTRDQGHHQIVARNQRAMAFKERNNYLKYFISLIQLEIIA